MNCCNHSLCLQLKCNCHNHQPQTAPSSQSPPESSAIYSKFAQTLEQQLSKQHSKYSQETDDLSSQLFTSKNSILRLELRNKKDNQALAELRRQFNLVLLKLRNQESKVVRQIEVVESIREVPVSSSQDEGLKQEVQFWKGKAEENYTELQTVKMGRDLAEESNSNLNVQLQKLTRTIQGLEGRLEELTTTVNDKERMIEKCNQNIMFLKNNKEVVLETKHLFPEFKASEKVRTETKVQTIYVEKPVEKIVFVDVQKRVKEFIQPARPYVNRVISCQTRSNCKCEDGEGEGEVQAYRTQVVNLNSCIDQLEGNIASYKVERGQLVDTIDAKNSEMNYMESKMRLIGGAGEAPTRSNFGSSVNVVVSKINNPAPSSQKVSTKNLTNPRKK